MENSRNNQFVFSIMYFSEWHNKISRCPVLPHLICESTSSIKLVVKTMMIIFKLPLFYLTVSPPIAKVMLVILLENIIIIVLFQYWLWLLISYKVTVCVSAYTTCTTLKGPGCWIFSVIWCWKLNMSLLEEQEVLSNVEPYPNCLRLFLLGYSITAIEKYRYI